MQFRVHYKDTGGHIRCRVFCAPAPDKVGMLLGTLTMIPTEFEAFMKCFTHHKLDTVMFTSNSEGD